MHCTTTRLMALAALMFGLAGVANAELIDIQNAGFEAANLADGHYGYSLAGWNVQLGSGGIGGGFNPTTSHFPDEAPEGDIVAWSDNSEISQVLDAVLLANTTYTLQADVGDRLDTSYAGYRIRLYSVGISSVGLAEDNSTVTPGNGEFTRATLVFTTGDTHTELGKPLMVSIRALPGTGSTQACFDNISLDATAVPEPAGIVGLLSMLLVGLVGFAWRRNK